MAVPDTTTFSLQDVEDAIPGTQGDLVQCFADAHPDGFDPLYEGSKNNLLNFRNYKHVTEVSLPLYQLDSIYDDAQTWAGVRGATAGTVRTAHPMYCWVEQYGLSYYIHRAFFYADLGSLPAGAEIVAASINARIVTKHNTLSAANNITVVRSTQGLTVDAADYDALTTDLFFNGALSIWQDANGNDILKKEATASDIANIKNYMGLHMYMCMRHGYDINNQPPETNEKIGYEFWLSGEVVANDFAAPKLYLKYQ